MRALVVCLLFLTLAVAGCVDDGPTVPAPTPPAAFEGPDPANDTASSVPEPRIETVAVHFNGTLGTHAFVCESGTLGACHGNAVREAENSVLIGQEGILRSMTATLTWQAASTATDRLVFRAMVMGMCEGCGSVFFDPVEGTSPLVIDLQGLDVAIPPEHVVHIFAYNPKGMVDQAPLRVIASVEQAVSIQATVAVEVPAA